MVLNALSELYLHVKDLIYMLNEHSKLDKKLKRSEFVL